MHGKYRFAALGLVLMLVFCTPGIAQRLPLEATPIHYQLTLTPDFAHNKYTGDEVIRVRILKPTSSITLNALEIEFEQASITSNHQTMSAKVVTDPEREMATLKAPKVVPPGPAEIHIRFKGILNNKLRGFYRAQESGLKYAITQFEPTDARRAFPCFDEPALKATFDITLIIPKGDMGISNSPVISDTPGLGPDQHIVRFATSAKMSSYLVALIVGDFKCLRGEADGIPIRVCAPPNQVQLGHFALESAEHILPFYEHYFGIRYPFKKLDLIAAPDFEAGAMENAGAITFRETYLLLDDRYASPAARKNVATVVAHEMAHQWFGDLVTMKWWNDIWLNEGFATWLSSKPVAAWKPEWNLQADDTLGTYSALSLDSMTATRPIRAPHAETSAQINQLFDGITYQKTAAILRMLEAYAGGDLFERGIHAYLTRFAYMNASAQDFWNTITQVSQKPVNQIMPTFVIQPGAPIVTVESRCEGNSTEVTLKQQRYFRDRARFQAGSPERWMIPVCLRSASGATQCVLLKQARQDFSLPGCSPWVFANSGAHGYYWLSYSPEVLKRISENAERSLTPEERITLIPDAEAMLSVGQIGIGDYLSTVEALSGDTHRAVMEEVTGALENVGETLVNSSDRDQYQALVRRLLRPAAQRLGWKPAPGENPEIQLMRVDVLGTLGYTGRDPEVLHEARQLADAYLKDRSAVDPSLSRMVLNLAALEGGQELYDEFLERSKAADSPGELYKFLYALTDFTQPALIDRTLAYSLTPAIREQDFPFFIGRLMRNPAAKDATWDFVKSNWPKVESKLSTWGGAYIISDTQSFCDASHRDDIEQFFKAHPNPASSTAFQRTLEHINHCIDLRSREAGKLRAWLGQQTATASLK
jgi:aminopeptidase N